MTVDQTPTTEKPFSNLNYGKQLIICIPSNEIPCHSLTGPNYTGLYILL